jgi:hypothetical protein
MSVGCWLAAFAALLHVCAAQTCGFHGVDLGLLNVATDYAFPPLYNENERFHMYDVAPLSSALCCRCLWMRGKHCESWLCV